MNLGAMLEVAIGIIFIWIVLSLTTIQIQEWITTRLDKRARDLEASIHEMLANPNLKSQFYDHPIIRGLTAKKRNTPSRIPVWFYRYPILRGFTREKRKLPSYIPAQQFSLTLFDIAMTANTESSLIQQGIFKLRDDLKKEAPSTVHKALIEELNLLAEFARSAAATEAGTAITKRTLERLKTGAENFIDNFYKNHPDLKLDDNVARILKEGMDTALKEAVRLKAEMDEVVRQQPPLDAATALSKVRQGVAALSVISPEVNQTLSALLLNVEEFAVDKEKRLGKARDNVEKWFNDSMDRASGVFKRYTQRVAFLIGLIVALVLNVDSVNLTLFLWRDPSVRQVLVAQASTFQIPAQETNGAVSPTDTAKQAAQQLQEWNLPVGWGLNKFEPNNCKLFPGDQQSFGIRFPFKNQCLVPPATKDPTNLLTKSLGIFITALAAMQGAPFWFDMLKRIVNIRSTGPNPAEKDGK